MNLLPVVPPERMVAWVLAIGWALVLFLGQGLLLALVVAALLRAWRDRSADLRYGLACAGLLAMASCPVVTTVLIARARHADAGSAEAGSKPTRVAFRARETTPAAGAKAEHSTGIPRTASDSPRRSVLRPESRVGASESAPIVRPAWRWRRQVEAWLPAVVGAWLAGVFGLSLRLVRGLVEVRSLTRRGVLAPTGEIASLIERLVERSGVRRPIGWFLSRRVEVPTVVGWLRPAVLIPAGSLARLTLRQLEALLAHELAHIRRHDYLVNILQVAVEALFFFQPAVWWVSKQIRIERENCCDDLAATLCDGDRRLIARALFAMEEQRSRAVLGVAADGGSLRQRVLRLMTPASPVRRPAEVGWAGAGLIAAVTGLMAMAWLALPTQAQDADARPSAHGRVLDEQGQPVSGARVRLYRRESYWEQTNRMVGETTAGRDGAYRLTTSRKPLPRPEYPSLAPYVLVADHPGKAIGWKTIPDLKDSFEGDIILTAPSERTIRVVDADGRPVAGAKVMAHGMGDSLSPLPYFQDHLSLQPEDGPLTALTGAGGRATLTQLPRTDVSFFATKPGFAGNYPSRDQDTIHLTPGATLAGTVAGPDGQPLAGVEVVLATTFMWHFERTVTDAKGRYHFADLRARGWDMSAWTKGDQANGQYKVWLENDRFAIPTKPLTLEPGAKQTLDLKAIEAGVIRVALVESGTNKPVANARLDGFDSEGGQSEPGRRFLANTDDQGRATFHVAPAATIYLGLWGPPEGVYIENEHMNNHDAHANFEFTGGEVDVRLVMPPIAGPLISVPGVGILPDGTPAADARVVAGADRFRTSTSTGLMAERRTDRRGQFTLREVPAGRSLQLYVETPDRRFAAVATIQTPDKADPEFQTKLNLVPTVTVDYQFVDAGGKPAASRKFEFSPKPREQELTRLRRVVESDAEGRVKFEGIVPGLTYRVVEITPPRPGPAGMMGIAAPMPQEPEPVLILAPAAGK